MEPLAPQTGLEPMTDGLTVRCSTSELHAIEATSSVPLELITLRVRSVVSRVGAYRRLVLVLSHSRPSDERRIEGFEPPIDRKMFFDAGYPGTSF